MFDIEKDIAYHYCSVESFFNIIQSKKFWLTDSEYTNDELEAKWIDFNIEEFISILKSGDNVPTMREEYEQLKGEIKKHYFMSFSKESDMLSQWRGYADDSKGVCIGFKFNFNEYDIDTSISTSSNIAKSNVSQFGIGEISYRDKNDIENELKDISSKSEFKYISNESLIKESLLFLKESCIFYKHPSFKEEQEVRIVYTPENNISTNISLSSLKYRYSDNQIIPYYELDFNNHISITKIILGSKCKLNEEDLKKFLQDNDFNDVEIVRSNSPYQ
jgi:hypothetical protein